jgi:hypothetical protein
MEEHRFNKFEYPLLRRIFGLEGKEELGEWRKFRKDELNNFHFSANIITLITSRNMRRSVHALRMRK